MAFANPRFWRPMLNSHPKVCFRLKKSNQRSQLAWKYHLRSGYLSQNGSWFEWHSLSPLVNQKPLSRTYYLVEVSQLFGDQLGREPIELLIHLRQFVIDSLVQSGYPTLRLHQPSFEVEQLQQSVGNVRLGVGQRWSQPLCPIYGGLLVD